LDIRSVSEITKYIKNIMEQDFILSRVMIRGEISNFKQYSSGHCYFTIKDANAALKAVMFRSRADHLKFLPVNGMKVVASGSISLYERDGAYQLYVQNLLPEGAGELSLAFEQLKTKLSEEGLFSATRKQAMPQFPKIIGVVTSPSGAVLRDIYRVAKRRNPMVKLVLYPVQVQGEQSAGQIVRAISFFNRKYPVDLLIVGRGGGSMEDLWSFNEEQVVRAIAASRLPIISAVGHETDYTLADFTADLRAATPSQAAELAVPDGRELRRYINSLRQQLKTKGLALLRSKRHRLEVCQKSKAMKSPQIMLLDKRQRLDYALEKLQRAAGDRLKAKQHKLQVSMERLSMLDPLKVLKRGYGVVETEKKIVRKIAEVKPGSKIKVLLSDGSFTAIVDEVREGNSNGEG